MWYGVELVSMLQREPDAKMNSIFVETGDKKRESRCPNMELELTLAEHRMSTI